MNDLKEEIAEIVRGFAAAKDLPPKPSLSLENLPQDCPDCIEHILKNLPPKSEHVDFNKLCLNLATYFKARGYTLQGALGLAGEFIENYSTSESHNTPQKRRANFESVWKSVVSGNGYRFDCSYIKGLHLPGSAFDCKKCPVKRNGQETAAAPAEMPATDTRKEAPQPAEDAPEMQGEKKDIAGDIDTQLKGLPPPLTPEDTRVHLTTRPPDPDYLLKFQGAGMIARGNVGGIVGASGTGKTTLLTRLALVMRKGGRWGPFEATRPLRVLFLPAEDDQNEIDRKIWEITGGQEIEGLHVKSLRGTIGPLMVYDGANPIPGPWWHWLKKTVELHQPLDILIPEPKNRYYGLEENSNEHNVAWVQCLEKLGQETGVTSIFSHHPPKGTRELNQWMARGGGGLVDACRWFMGLLPMSEEEGKRYGVTDWMNHFQAAVVKTNVGPKSKGSSWFRMTETGIIEPADVVEMKEANWGRRLSELLQDRLQDPDCSPKYLTERELKKGFEGKVVADIMREAFSGFRRGADMPAAIKWAVKWDLLKEMVVPQEKGSSRMELVPLAEAMKEHQNEF
jgi:replicative DNA helicase